MSFACHRGLFGESLGSMRVLGGRSLGGGGPPVRVPSSLPCVSCSFQCSHSPSELLPIVHQECCSVCCCCRSLCERSDRTCSSFSRLLQSPVCHPQSHRGLAACHRSFVSQPFCSRLSFSHGDSTDGSPVSPSGGLVGLSRSPRRLPPGSSASDISPLPEVLCGGSGVSVSCTLFRPFNCAAGFRSCHGPNLVDNASFRLSDSEVPQ